jgi:hypothetical protein
MPDGLRERRFVHGAVAPRLFAGAGVRIRLIVQQIDHPDLVRARHRHDQDAGLSARSHGEFRSMRIASPPSPPHAPACRCRHRVHGTRLEIDDADLVVLGVGDVQLIMIQREALEGR